MSRLSFFFKRLVRMDWKAMWKTTENPEGAERQRAACGFCATCCAAR